MSERRITSTARGRDLPLVLFTSTAVMGAGIAAVQPLLWLLSGSFSLPGTFEVFLIAALLGIGLLTSLTHLGRKERMLLAMSRTGRSPLSTEVVLAVIVFVAALVMLLLNLRDLYILWMLTIIASVLLLVDIGFLYRLGGQITWRGASTIAPFVTGLLWGSLLRAVLTTRPADFAMAAVYGLLALDTVVTLMRWQRFRQIGSRGEPRDEGLFRKRDSLMFGRIIITDVLTLCALLLIGPVAAIISATAGVFLDRYLFYALGVQHTTESEISRIESLIHETDAV